MNEANLSGPVVAAMKKKHSVQAKVKAPNAGNAGDSPAASFTPGNAKYSAEGMVINRREAVTVLYLRSKNTSEWRPCFEFLRLFCVTYSSGGPHTSLPPNASTFRP